MSLTDLKKTKDSKPKKKIFTVDEFIEDAENYAKGAPQLVSRYEQNAVALEQAVLIAKQHAELQQQHSAKPFRHATFTLSEQAIEQLQQLAQQSNLAKSHIIRILINELCTQDQREQLQKLLNSDTN